MRTQSLIKLKTDFSKASLFFACLTALILLALPEMAFASGGIAEFAGPMQKVIDTLTGPIGKMIAIGGMVICGVMFIYNKDDISGGFKLLISIVFGICFIAFAAGIVDSLFSFSGAVI